MWIEEFLFRGREEGSKQPPAWHVVLANRVDDGLGGTHVVTKLLNVAQAEAAGFPLSKLVADMNAELLKSHDTVSVERDKLNERVAMLEKEATSGEKS